MDLDAEKRWSLFRLVEPPVERLGCELVAVELVGGGGRATLRVSVDRPGGVSVGDCAGISRALSVLLDVEDPLPGPYDLEVSSPGPERPIQKPRDFERFAGRRARIGLLRPIDGHRSLSGRLAGTAGRELLLDTAEGRRHIPFEAIRRARLLPGSDEPSPRGEREGQRGHAS